MNKVVVIDEDKCTACGKCVRICPRRILYIDKEARACKVTDELKCDRLRGCQIVCPVNAIKII